MKYIHKMEQVLITLTGFLCAILLIKLLFKLRLRLIWRVNCWFCNTNSWVKYPERNSWTCSKCDQYNGFTKDGDYNKALVTSNDQSFKVPKIFQKSPPCNGLCKMCNINQQLKVIQLANFVPMNEKSFDEEIESYKMQLEKAYKLCSPCKKVVQTKLHKEKETLLGSKLLESRTTDMKNQIIKETQNKLLKKVINGMSMCVAALLVVLVSFELYSNVTNSKNVSQTITNLKETISGLFERIYTIIKMKTLMTFPSLENYFYDMTLIYLDLLPNRIYLTGYINTITQQALGGFVCSIQIIGHIWNINSIKYSIVIDLLWSVFIMTSIAHPSGVIHPVLISLFKLSSTLIVLLVYRNMESNTGKKPLRLQASSNKFRNNSNGTVKSSLIDDDDSISMDTDDDVSLNKFGLHNFSESSNETISPLNNSVINGRSFTPRTDSAWTKPKLNSSFCINPVIVKTPSSVSEPVFVKPSFNKYQNLTKDESDSELDESISSLCIGSPKKAKRKSNSIFSLRKFTATPNFVVPMPMTKARPLISPSKLGHSTSWVAGGYWGSEGERQLFNIDGSRSSSQSSGFESQTSSMNQRNLFSQPSSQEGSICSEPMVLDRFSNAGNLGSFQMPQNFSRVSSPVFPQMQYNSHIHIPQPRFPQQKLTQNVFTQQQYVQENMFKTPGGTGLIKLPQANSFTAR